jgi:GMP synthase (glutamine-hydrolysing)
MKVLVVQHESECPPGLFGGWLSDAGCELDVRHPYAGDTLPTLDGYGGLLVLGGAMGANDDALLGWIAPTKELLRDALAEAVSTLGICLGHQLIGAALGGTVAPNPRGRMVGLHSVGWTDAATGDDLVGALATPRRGIQWNNDLVLELPPGATLLAATAYGEAQVVRYGPLMWGVQHHPEADAAIVTTWVSDSEKAELAERGIDADAELAAIHAAREELEQAWAPLAAGFADLVLGPVPGPVPGPPARV